METSRVLRRHRQIVLEAGTGLFALLFVAIGVWVGTRGAPPLSAPAGREHVEAGVTFIALAQDRVPSLPAAAPVPDATEAGRDPARDGRTTASPGAPMAPAPSPAGSTTAAPTPVPAASSPAPSDPTRTVTPPSAPAPRPPTSPAPTTPPVTSPPLVQELVDLAEGVLETGSSLLK